MGVSNLSPPPGCKFASPARHYIQAAKRISLRDLAKAWGISKTTIFRWSSLGNWEAKREQYWARVDALEEADRARKVARIRSHVHATHARVSSKALRKVEELLDEPTPVGTPEQQVAVLKARERLAAQLAKLVPLIAPLARERRIAYTLEQPAGAVDNSNRQPRPEPHASDTLLGPVPAGVDPADDNAGDSQSVDDDVGTDPTFPGGGNVEP